MTQSDQELQRELERLRTENAALKSRRQREIRLQVSQKGAVSLYGLRRFPVTFYLEEWNQILDRSGEIRAFLKKHESELKTKQSNPA